jgi:hypothetical protein
MSGVPAIEQHGRLLTGATVHFSRNELGTDLSRMRSDRRPAVRAIGDNFLFEENVGTERVADFEAFDAAAPGLRAAAGEYFFSSVQGETRDHIPSTFLPVNAAALLSTIERAQKIVRVERIDDAMQKALVDYDGLRRAVAATPRDMTVVAPILRALNGYPGARPAWACFRAEVAADLRAADWLDRLLARLGLGHHALATGQSAHFALMEYTVEQVFQEAVPAQPFAVPTVLEAHNSPHFFPAPAGHGAGYAVDLDHGAGRDPIHEILHVRLTYRADHLARVAQLTGPTPVVNIATARDAHLSRVRAACARVDYGAAMSGEVDT